MIAAQPAWIQIPIGIPCSGVARQRLGARRS
jgi:hypothetical protein